MTLQNLRMMDEAPDALEEHSSVARLPIDYDKVLADFEPGAPGGVIVFSTRGYATDEEADAAHEAFLLEIFEVQDEDA